MSPATGKKVEKVAGQEWAGLREPGVDRCFARPLEEQADMSGWWLMLRAQGQGQAHVTQLEKAGPQMVSEAGEHTCTRVDEISPKVDP